MRITGGLARGIVLDAPRGDSTRPATDAARLAIFSSLGDAVWQARVLDFFAGTGSYGLEAVSRGAASATFVEADRIAAKILRNNASKLASALPNASINILQSDVFKLTLKKGDFDLVFADPPYSMLSDIKLLDKILISFQSVADKNTLFMLEAPGEFDFPEGVFTVVKRLGKKSKGKPSQIIFKLAD